MYFLAHCNYFCDELLFCENKNFAKLEICASLNLESCNLSLSQRQREREGGLLLLYPIVSSKQLSFIYRTYLPLRKAII